MFRPIRSTLVIRVLLLTAAVPIAEGVGPSLAVAVVVTAVARAAVGMGVAPKVEVASGARVARAVEVAEVVATAVTVHRPSTSSTIDKMNKRKRDRP